jgi:hypothetical protein
MAKNLSRKFATMNEDEQRRFAMEAEEGTDAAPAELDFEDPRTEEEGDPTDRDGTSALLDEQAHRRNIDKPR